MSDLSRKLKIKKAQLLYADFGKASKRLKEIAAAPFSMVNRDATIKRFEFTFEVAWKLIKTIVELSGLKSASPKSAIRQAADIGLIDNPKRWFNFLENRNLTVHMYKEKVAESVYKEAKKFIPFIDKLLETAKSHLI